MIVCVVFRHFKLVAEIGRWLMAETLIQIRMHPLQLESPSGSFILKA